MGVLFRVLDVEIVNMEVLFIGGIACEASLIGTPDAPIVVRVFVHMVCRLALLAMLECRAEDTPVVAIEEVFYAFKLRYKNLKAYQDSGELTTV